MNSFAARLWDRVDVVSQYSQERRREIEDFISVINKRIDAEDSYSKTLEDAARLANKIRQGDESVSSLAFSSFKFDCINRSTQAKVFSKSLKDEVLNPLKEMLVAQNQETKVLQKNYKKLSKELDESQYQLTKAHNKFHDEYKDKVQTLISNEILLQSMKTVKEKRMKAISKSGDIIKNLTDIEKVYQKSAVEYNIFIHRYYEQIQNILSVYQKHEQTRLARQQQNIMKTLIFETSMMKNFQYDIVTITNQVEQARQLDDIKDFIQSTETGEQKMTQRNLSIPRDLMAWSLFHINNKSFEKRIGLQLNKELKIFIEKRFKGEPCECSIFQSSKLQQFDNIFEIIVQAWKGLEIQKLQLQSLKTLLKDEVNRLILFLYIQQYLLTLNTVLSEQGYKEVVCLLAQILDLCLESKDVFVARKLTNLAFSFYMSREEQKYYVHFNLSDCKIYEDPEYWKASVFQSVQEELYLNYGNKMEQEIEMREMSLIVGQLALYCHQMILLGVSNKSVRQLIGYFCKLYSIPNDRNNDLSKTVSLSVKKYQEMFALTETTKSVESNFSVDANMSEYDFSELHKRKTSMDEIPEISDGGKEENKIEPVFLKQAKLQTS